MIDGLAAALWLLNYGSVQPSMCLYYVWQAYKAQGASTDLSAQTAYEAWGMSDGKRPGDRNPPAGAAVWWGRRYRDGNMDGDVTISLGGGRVSVTEPPNQGYVTGSCTLDERENEIGREYLGWTSSIFDCPIELGGTSGNAAPASTPTTDTTTSPSILSEEDAMLLFQIDPATDGRWVIVDVHTGTYWQVSNGLQLDALRGTPGLKELAGPQPPSLLDGITPKASAPKA